MLYRISSNSNLGYYLYFQPFKCSYTIRGWLLFCLALALMRLLYVYVCICIYYVSLSTFRELIKFVLTACTKLCFGCSENSKQMVDDIVMLMNLVFQAKEHKV